MDTKDKLKHNKCNVQQTYSQHRPKLRETQRISSKTKKKTKVSPSFHLFNIQYLKSYLEQSDN